MANVEHVEVAAAMRAEEPVVANLLQLYAYDFTEFQDLELSADGKFEYKHLSLYWREPNRCPFLVRVDRKLAGFVLVKKGSELSGNENVWDVAEFFIMRRYRRNGIGTEAARQLWRRLPGPWEVRVMNSNGPAARFWQHAVSLFTGQTITPLQCQVNGGSWSVFSFESASNMSEVP